MLRPASDADLAESAQRTTDQISRGWDAGVPAVEAVVNSLS